MIKGKQHKPLLSVIDNYIVLGIMSFIESACIDAIIQFNEAKATAIIEFNRVRSENAVVDILCSMTEMIVSLIHTLYLFLTRRKIESSAPAYISAYYYNPTTKKSEETFKEYSVEMYQWMAFREHFTEEYQEFVAKYRDHADTTLFTAKLAEDEYRIRLATNADGVKDVLVPGTRSGVQFLSVEYFCGDNHGPITVDIPREHYMVGNEILSMEYVLRYLEYLPTYVEWKFYEFYTIQITDENLQKISLRSNQWILLKEDGYEICSVEAEEEEEDQEEDQDQDQDPDQEEEEEKAQSEEETSSAGSHLEDDDDDESFDSCSITSDTPTKTKID